MASYFSLFLCKISFEASPIAEIMNSKSSNMSTFCIFGLLDLDFFHDEGFMGETFLFLDGSVSSRRFFGGVTSPFYLLLFLFPLCSLCHHLLC
jgi:hypothetical protein